MKAWLLTLLLLAMAYTCHHWRDEIRHHLLGKKTLISQTRISEQTAGLVFRGLPFDEAKAAAWEQLQSNAAIRAARLQDSTFASHATSHLEDEIRSWQRQWDKPEERQQRLEGQRLTEAVMADEIAAALLDRTWIEQQIQDETRITDQELKSAWQARKDAIPVSQVHLTSHLFLSRHGPEKSNRVAEIQAIEHKLKAGAGWRELVQKNSQDPRTRQANGHLGWLSDLRIPKAFAVALSKLQPGQTSAPVATTLGWHLIRLEERRPARAITFEEIRPEFEAKLVWQKRQAAMDKLLARLTTQTQQSKR